MLVASTVVMSRAKPCDLEKVLVSLSVDYASPCRYNDIKENSTALCIWGMFSLVLNEIIILLILIVLWVPIFKETDICNRVSTLWNIYENISFVVNIKQQTCYFSVLAILLLQVAGIIVIAFFGASHLAGMIYCTYKVLDFKEKQTYTVCITQDENCFIPWKTVLCTRL